jgi:hypothetical protein
MANHDIENLVQNVFDDRRPSTLSELVAIRYMENQVYPAVAKHHPEIKYIASGVHYSEEFSRALDPAGAEKIYIMFFYRVEGSDLTKLTDVLFQAPIKVVALNETNFRVDAVRATEEGTDETGKYLTRFEVVEGGSKNYFVTSASNGNYLIHAKD